MKTPLLLIALSLAACHRAAAENDQALTQAEAQIYTEWVQNGVSPAEAKARLDAARQLMHNVASDDAIAYQEAQRKKEISDVRADQCKREPYLEGC